MSEQLSEHYSPLELQSLMGRVNARYEEWRWDEDVTSYLLSVVEWWKDDSEDGNFLEWLTDATTRVVLDWASEQQAEEDEFVEPYTCQDCEESWATQTVGGQLICGDCLISRRAGGEDL